MNRSDEKKLVLVVEDSDLVREHVVNLVESLGYSVLQAANGKEAMEILETQSGIDLLFTDVMMPGGISGKELAIQAKLVAPEMKVLYTTGFSSEGIVSDGILDSGIQLLKKPYKRADLKRMLLGLLGPS